MKRDWDVIRKILLTCETAAPGKQVRSVDFDHVDPSVLYHHVLMLNEAGYVRAQMLRYTNDTTGGGDFVILGLAWDGHDLLAKMASEKWWSKIKAIAADRGLSMTFEVIKALALPAAKGLLGLEGSE